MPDQTITGKLSVTDSIGVGTDTPNAQLHIDADATEGKVLIESGGNLFKLLVDGTGATIGTVNAIPFALQTDGSSRLTFDASGNVGVGKAPSAVKLDVNGLVNATGFNRGGVPWRIQTGDLEDNAVTAAKIADLNVTTSELANGAVTEGKLAANAVTEAKIANNSVTNAKIADQAINAAKILAGSISTLQLGANAVTSDKILDAAITAAKLAAGVIPRDVGVAVSSALSHGATIPPPSGFAVSECVFFAFCKTVIIPNVGDSFTVFADTSGKVTATRSSNAKGNEGAGIIAIGVAIAKRGGWA
jgi:hypothetical protein